MTRHAHDQDNPELLDRIEKFLRQRLRPDEMAQLMAILGGDEPGDPLGAMDGFAKRFPAAAKIQHDNWGVPPPPRRDAHRVGLAADAAARKLRIKPFDERFPNAAKIAFGNWSR